MAAELGQTTDPTALIPGEPERIANDLREMVGIITNLGGISEGLGGIDPLDWTGEASTAFRSVFAQEPPKWLQAVDQLSGGSEGLADFADTLTWAQGEAQRAIEMYTEAQAASRAAAAEYNVLQQAAQAAGEIIAPFVDPAQQAVEEATAVLSNAREELAAAGGVAAQALGFQSDGEGGYERPLGERAFGADNRRTQIDPTTGQPVDPGGWQSGRGGRSYQREWGQGSGGLFDLDGTLARLGIDVPSKEWRTPEAEVAVWKGETGEGDFDAGWVDGRGTASAAALGAGAEAHANASLTGVSAGARAEAYLAKAEAEGELNFGEHVTVAGQGEVFVGAEAYADGSIGLTGAQGEAGAFAGARAVGEASAEVGGVGAGVTGEAWAGAGAEVSGQFGMGEDGKFHIGAEAGVGLGYGGKLGFDVSVDPDQVVDSVSSVASDVGDVAGDVGGAIGDGAGAVGDALGF